MKTFHKTGGGKETAKVIGARQGSLDSWKVRRHSTAPPSNPKMQSEKYSMISWFGLANVKLQLFKLQEIQCQ